ncbi:MAG TPA: CDF family Co(II)/Ni(II) efflux transporter DmeF [Sphingomicrobium sp.]|nr:CDF family Co(II)/Ni(II) efflux transporter DmeF [Sphingomicrobium sp.]
MATRHELEDAAHDHDFLGASHDRNAKRTWWVVALTSVMMVAEIAAGLITGSMALLADGFHMATHAGALAVAAAAYWFARRHVANPRFTFGTGKVGDLAGFASALILGVAALGIATESVLRLLDPVRVDFGDAIVVAVLGLGVNLVSAAMLSHGHTHSHDHEWAAGQHHHHHHDHNLRAAYLHVLADALTSVLAIVALTAGRYLGWVWLDPVMGIVGAIVIARWSWILLRQTAEVLLDTADSRLMERIRSAVEEGGEATIADLHVWRIGPQAHAAIVSAEGPRQADEIRRRLAGISTLAHVTIEIVERREG